MVATTRQQVVEKNEQRHHQAKIRTGLVAVERSDPNKPELIQPRKRKP